MNTQPAALRLADILGEQLFAERTGNNYGKDAATELRRLRDLNNDKTEIIAALSARITALEQANAELLEALNAADWYIGQLEPLVYGPDDDGVHEEHAKVRAAIAKHGELK